MNKLKIALTIAPALKNVKYEKDVKKIVIFTNISKNKWEETLSQHDKNKKLHLYWYKSEK